MIFNPKMPSEFRCPNCHSNEFIDYGDLVECIYCGFEFFKEFIDSEIDEDNILSDQDLNSLTESFKEEFKEEQTQKRFSKLIKKDLEDTEE
ncbi:MAG: hypothetical protein ACFFAA_03725 [Promethearchaeota archaeon]